MSCDRSVPKMYSVYLSDKGSFVSCEEFRFVDNTTRFKELLRWNNFFRVNVIAYSEDGATHEAQETYFKKFD